MSTISYTLPTIGNPNSTEQPYVRTALSTIQTFLNGQNIDATNLANGGVSKAKLGTDALQNFLQLLTAKTLRLAYGTAGVTFSTAAEASTLIAHGLGTVPVLAGAFGIISGTGDAGDQTTWSVYQTDATNVGFYGRSSRGTSLGPGTISMFWFAIG